QQFVAPHLRMPSQAQEEVKQYINTVTGRPTELPQTPQHNTIQPVQQPQQQQSAPVQQEPVQKPAEEDEWDIPAFLRQRN
ncbi:MAG: hypothetical protein QG600_697, partial [Patescibacteria group bacterium]|nr:hypothetical protein [Patescibacteria group bacterium]